MTTSFVGPKQSMHNQGPSVIGEKFRNYGLGRGRREAWKNICWDHVSLDSFGDGLTKHYIGEAGGPEVALGCRLMQKIQGIEGSMVKVGVALLRV